MVLDPAARLTAKKALQHPWVQVILVTYLHIDERIVEILELFPGKKKHYLHFV